MFHLNAGYDNNDV